MGTDKSKQLAGKEQTEGQIILVQFNKAVKGHKTVLE